MVYNEKMIADSYHNMTVETQPKLLLYYSSTQKQNNHDTNVK